MEGLPRVGLIVTADDFGFCSERDRGILEAYREGVVTSACLLVTGSSVEKAVCMAKEGELALGMHLNLTEGPPVSAPEDVPTLLCSCKSWWPDGAQNMERLEFRGKAGLRKALTR
jgi:predicted glycoside hydrolase/deacetylase ChbG (UPF0249 family)